MRPALAPDWRFWRKSLAISIAAAAGLVDTARAAVIVQQVEAFENSPTNTHYAPVEFGGSSTATSPSFPGVIFHAQANTADTVSNHAITVASRFYGASTVAQPYATNVFNNSATNFLNGLNAQSGPGALQLAPSGYGNGIKVSNHSYVATFGDAATDENVVRRIDYITNNEDVVLVAAAANAVSGTLSGQNLPWASHDGLAVRGNSTITPFVPPATGPGKRRADVWQDEEASYATGRVSGYATGLIGQAATALQSDAMHNQVVRSLLMTGADKISADGAGGTMAFDPTLPNHLSVGSGAGKANYASSCALLQAGERTAQTLTGNVVGGAATAASAGWTYATVPANGASVVILQIPSGSISNLVATLNWNVTQKSTGATIDTTDAGRIFSNLDLELRPATLSGGQFTVGGKFADANLNSDSTNDNAESLYFNGTTNLPAGYYALYVKNNDASNATPFGLSYSVNSVPEPSGLGAVLLVAGGLMARYRRRSARSTSQM
jgi:hypothetical protein